MRKRGITVFTLSMMLALGTATLTTYAQDGSSQGQTGSIMILIIIR